MKKSKNKNKSSNKTENQKFTLSSSIIAVFLIFFSLVQSILLFVIFELKEELTKELTLIYLKVELIESKIVEMESFTATEQKKSIFEMLSFDQFYFALGIVTVVVGSYVTTKVLIPAIITLVKKKLSLVLTAFFEQLFKESLSPKQGQILDKPVVEEALVESSEVVSNTLEYLLLFLL